MVVSEILFPNRNKEYLLKDPKNQDAMKYRINLINYGFIKMGI